MDQAQIKQQDAALEQPRPKPRGTPFPPGVSGNPSGNPVPKAFAALYAGMLGEFAAMGVELRATDKALLGSAARLLARRMKSDLTAVKAASAARRIIDTVHERHRPRRVYRRRDEPSPSGWSPLRSSLSEVTDTDPNGSTSDPNGSTERTAASPLPEEAS